MLLHRIIFDIVSNGEFLISLLNIILIGIVVETTEAYGININKAREKNYIGDFTQNTFAKYQIGENNMDNTKIFSFVVGYRYHEENPNSTIGCYSYGGEVQQGTMEDAMAFRQAVAEMVAYKRNWRIFKLSEVSE